MYQAKSGVLFPAMRLLLAALPLALLTACGGGGSSTPAVSSGADVAKVVGCTGYQGGTEQQYVAEGGTCKVDGADVYVYYFADNADRDNWVKVATVAAGGEYVVGDHFAAQGDTSQVKAMAAKSGAPVKS